MDPDHSHVSSSDTNQDHEMLESISSLERYAVPPVYPVPDPSVDEGEENHAFPREIEEHQAPRWVADGERFDEELDFGYPTSDAHQLTQFSIDALMSRTSVEYQGK